MRYSEGTSGMIATFSSPSFRGGWVEHSKAHNHRQVGFFALDSPGMDRLVCRNERKTLRAEKKQ
jgi:hypothetical protein